LITQLVSSSVSKGIFLKTPNVKVISTGFLSNQLFLVQAISLSLVFYLLISYLSIANAAVSSLEVTLVDGISQHIMTDTKITAYKKQSDGSLEWAKNLYTDEGGQGVFELEGLGAGTTYVLITKAFNHIKSYSRAITQSGSFDFIVGKLKVTVVDANESLLLDTKVTVYENLGEENEWRTSGYTDEQGIIRFDLEGVGSGRNYFLKARSPVDESYKKSAVLTQNGLMIFKVGNRALNVKLVNDITDQAIDNIEITAYERLVNGDLAWSGKHTTDAQGETVFDLDGLGDGRNYVLSAKVYNNIRTFSQEIHQTGELEFAVGSLEVSLLSGIDASLLANYSVSAYERMEDGSNAWRNRGMTDSQL
jgi:large repetitive protein